MTAFVKYHGFHVLFQAHNGRNCISQLHEQNILPDLCILDARMSEWDGFQTARYIRRFWPGIRIMLFSLIDDADVMENAKRSGIDIAVGKNWEPKDILIAIRNLLQSG